MTPAERAAWRYAIPPMPEAEPEEVPPTPRDLLHAALVLLGYVTAVFAGACVFAAYLNASIG